MNITYSDRLFPGDMGRVIEMHGTYYASHWDFTSFFEAEVAEGMGSFFMRFDPARDAFFTARAGERLVGSLTIDGAPDDPADARIRWVILDPDFHGRGIGSRLMQLGMDFCRELGYDHIYLDTFKGLDAACALYERHGFTITDEHPHTDWGPTVTLTRYDKTGHAE